MPVAELDVRLRGRAERPLEVTSAGAITKADLSLLQSERGTRPPQIKRLHDRHHSLARCLAQGLSNTEASAITGYDFSRISILKADPMFQDLIAHYREVRDAAFGDFQDRAATVALQALEIIQTHVEGTLEGTADEPMSSKEALGVVESLADRTGNAPVTRSIAVGVNVDLGGRLSQARQRIAKSERSEGAEGNIPKISDNKDEAA